MSKITTFLLSVAVPGLGHIIQGKVKKGLGFFLSTIPPLAIIGWLYYTHLYDPAINAFGSVDRHLEVINIMRLRYLFVSVPFFVDWLMGIIDSTRSLTKDRGRHKERRMSGTTSSSAY